MPHIESSIITKRPLPWVRVSRFIRAMFFTYCENGVTSGG